MVDSRVIEQRAAQWLARRASGDWDPEQQQALDAWLDASTAHRVAFLRLDAAWRESGRLTALGAGHMRGTPPPRGLGTGSTRDPRALRSTGSTASASGPPDVGRLVFAPRDRRPVRWPHRVGAAVVMLAMLSVFAFGWRWYGAIEQASYATTLGALRGVPLSDGSRATLSSDSGIAVRLSRSERRIELQRGEAFFEAAKDPGRPFVVSAGNRHVVAVGTRFSVRRDGPDLRVVVTEGTVRLESLPGVDGHAQPTTLLPAGSIAMASREGVFVRTGSVADAERLVDWRSGFLTFQDTTLADAAREFNRYNPRKLVMGDPQVAQLRVGGNFRWSNTEAFVRLLEQGFPVRAEHQTDRIVLHSR